MLSHEGVPGERWGFARSFKIDAVTTVTILIVNGASRLSLRGSKRPDGLPRRFLRGNGGRRHA
jgi:hypothetical protein